ncbi:hypothetical protein CVT26_004337 [Gymnopilus dilepis]|uniref:Uncharacterized protein n=1 Tax=Gymnopilus dilepis TaxID=231916 RepID=A0A409W292_9AGAR|nr:hypothetical protein CVT26_004337 [Gymnopilus dilepis]
MQAPVPARHSTCSAASTKKNSDILYVNVEYISILLVTIIQILFIITALAEPVPILEAKPKSPPAADTVVAYIQAHPNDINPSCFFSGQTLVTTKKGKTTVTVKKTAESLLNKFKTDHGCHVIAEIVGKAGVSTGGLTDADWKKISKAFAQSVTGTVYVLLGKDVRSNSVWLADEKPALKTNGQVTSVQVYEIDTDGTVKKTSLTKGTM